MEGQRRNNGGTMEGQRRNNGGTKVEQRWNGGFAFSCVGYLGLMYYPLDELHLFRSKEALLFIRELNVFQT